MTLSATQLRNARLLLGWSRDRVAPMIGVSTGTLRKLEKGDVAGFDDARSRARTLFEHVGFEFTDDGPPGLRMRAGRSLDAH